MKAAIINFDESDKSLENIKTQLNNWSGLENLDLASFVSPMPYKKLQKGYGILKKIHIQLK